MTHIHLVHRSALASVVALVVTAGVAGAASQIPRLDTSFSDDGVATYSVAGRQAFHNSAVAGGDIYAVGVSVDGDRSRGLLVRYNDNGRRDVSFSGDGVVMSASRDARWWDVLVQPDGKVVVAGPDGPGHITVARFLASGRYDQTFSGDGMKSLVVRKPGWRVWLDLDSTGRVVVAGSGYPDGTWKSNGYVARLTAAGVLDDTFSGDGTRLVDLGYTDNIASLDVDSTDRPILLISHFRPSADEAGADLVRLTTLGALDKTFAGDGSRLLTYQSRGGIWPLAVEQDTGGLLWVGASGATDNTLAVFRVLDSGKLDASYDGDGVSKAETDISVNFWHGGKLTDSGYVFAGGRYPLNEAPQKLYLARFAPGGGFDPTFGSAGEYVTDIRVGTEYHIGVTVDGSGRLVVTGEDLTAGVVSRFLTTAP